jgi:hypothetical protein
MSSCVMLPIIPSSHQSEGVSAVTSLRERKLNAGTCVDVCDAKGANLEVLHYVQYCDVALAFGMREMMSTIHPVF